MATERDMVSLCMTPVCVSVHSLCVALRTRPAHTPRALRFWRHGAGSPLSVSSGREWIEKRFLEILMEAHFYNSLSFSFNSYSPSLPQNPYRDRCTYDPRDFYR